MTATTVETKPDETAATHTDAASTSETAGAGTTDATAGSDSSKAGATTSNDATATATTRAKTTDKATPTTSGDAPTPGKTSDTAKKPTKTLAKQEKHQREPKSRYPAQASLVLRATGTWDRELTSWVSLPSGCSATYLQRNEHSSAVHVVCADGEVDIERQDDAASLTCGSTSCTRCTNLDAAVLIPPRGGSFTPTRTSCQENGK